MSPTCLFLLQEYPGKVRRPWRSIFPFHNFSQLILKGLPTNGPVSLTIVFFGYCIISSLSIVSSPKSPKEKRNYFLDMFPYKSSFIQSQFLIRVFSLSLTRCILNGCSFQPNLHPGEPLGRSKMSKWVGWGNLGVVYSTCENISIPLFMSSVLIKLYMCTSVNKKIIYKHMTLIFTSPHTIIKNISPN